MQPTVYVIAGPNGVGKSTAAYRLIPMGTEQINPDDIARQYRQQFNQQEIILQHTNDEARRRMETNLARRASFSVETNLYDQATWQYFLAVQQSGYAFDLLFLCTSHLATLVERVRNRQQQGGHFVREDVIRERYHNGLLWLNHYFDQPSSLTLFDTANGFMPVYRRLDGAVQHQADPLPDWVIQHLAKWIGLAADPTQQTVRRASSIGEVRELYEVLKNKPLPGSDSSK
jgi:predicted ABC-type ATPase